MLIEAYGNLVKDVSYAVFCHQTNIMGVMGAGLALQIKEAYPEVYSEHKSYCWQARSNGQSILGTNLYIRTFDGRTCVNMYAQAAYGTDRRYTDYEAFKSCLDRLTGKLLLSDTSLKVAFPYRIGCGLGGGDWKIIYEMLYKLSQSVKQDIYILNLCTI